MHWLKKREQKLSISEFINTSYSPLTVKLSLQTSDCLKTKVRLEFIRKKIKPGQTCGQYFSTFSFLVDLLINDRNGLDQKALKH
jgi:hypothetical protein